MKLGQDNSEPSIVLILKGQQQLKSMERSFKGSSTLSDNSILCFSREANITEKRSSHFLRSIQHHPNLQKHSGLGFGSLTHAESYQQGYSGHYATKYEQEYQILWAEILWDWSRAKGESAFCAAKSPNYLQIERAITEARATLNSP